MTLDPRHLPRSYPQMLQDLIDMNHRLATFGSTDAEHMLIMLTPAIGLAVSQLRKIEQAAVKRMVKP
jgi:hypothetical protein